MVHFKCLTDPRFLKTLSAGLVRQKEMAGVVFSNQQEIPVRIIANSTQQSGFIIYPRNESAAFPEGVFSEATVKISFIDKEIFFVFEAAVLESHPEWFRVDPPQAVFASFRRLVERYRPQPDEVTFGLWGRSEKCHLVDISTKGLAFLSPARLFEEGRPVRHLTVDFSNGPKLNLDGVVRHVTLPARGGFLFGVEITNISWSDHQKLSAYLYAKMHPHVGMLASFSGEQLLGLYENTRVLHIKSRDREDEEFRESLYHLEQLKDKPLIAVNLIYQMHQKLIALSPAIRIYERSFLGKPLIMLPQVRLNPKHKSDAYVSLADYLLNHPYFTCYLSYIDSDYEWHCDLMNAAAQIIAAPEKFYFDNMTRFEYRRDASGELPAAALQTESTNYDCEMMDQPDAQFYEFCQRKMNPLETACYDYTAPAFPLNELSQIYQAYGFYVSRKLWRIFKRRKLVAYAVAECYSEVISRHGHLNQCRIYPVAEPVDSAELVKSLFPELEIFYRLHEKASFEVMLPGGLVNIPDLQIPFLAYKGRIGRVMADRAGFAAYKKLLSANFAYESTFYPLTYPQLGIWYLEKMYPGTGIANLVMIVRVGGELDYGLLAQAINLTVAKNPGLRIRWCEEEGTPKQYLVDYEPQKIDFLDFSSDPVQEFNQWGKMQALTPFPVFNAPLYYFATFKLGAAEGGFCIKTHHAVSDAWTVAMVINQIFAIYDALKNNREIPAGTNPAYLDYIFHEEDYKYGPRFMTDRQFWMEKFQTFPELTAFKARGRNEQNIRSKRMTHLISQGLSYQITAFCQEHEVSVFGLFLSVLGVLLARTTMKNDLVIGAPVLNRANAKEKLTAGMFVSPVPVRMPFLDNQSFSAYSALVAKEWQQVLKHQKYPYELLLKEIREKFGYSGNLYDIAFSYQNVKLEIGNYFKDYSAHWTPNDNQVESLNIHVSNRDADGQFLVDLDYLTGFFSDSEMARFYEQFACLLSDAVTNPQRNVRELEILSPQEKQRIFTEFSHGPRRQFEQRPIQQLFEEQAEKTPDRIALSVGDSRISYRELNQKANQLARTLRKRGIRPNIPVGIVMERSVAMIVSVLGVLKSGGAYLPVDPHYPAMRIQYLLEDGGVERVIVNPSFWEDRIFPGDVIHYNDAAIWGEDTANLPLINRPQDLAYIIYTSGTTGTPKGVMIEHGAISARLQWRIAEYRLGSADRVLHFISYCFDAFVTSFFTPLLSGATIFLLRDNEVKDPQIITEMIVGQQITHWVATSSLFAAVIGYLTPAAAQSLRIIAMGGEAVSPQAMTDSKMKNSNLELVNEYGPTEAAVVATIYRNMNSESCHLIGKPISNTRIYIMDQRCGLVPVGIPGEIHIAGEGLARGYLSRPDLTAAKFLADPFYPGEKMYRTGDWGKWQPDGNIVFLGRNDEQVKVKGFRIELAEIETQLEKVDPVRRAVVKVWEDEAHHKYLCAYVACTRAVSPSEIRRQLLKFLPDYMIPAAFVFMDPIPLTPNGKVDHQALLPPHREQREAELAHEATSGPQNETERKLAVIWQRILNLEQVGMEDAFFEIGGDSLSAFEMLCQIKKDLQVDVAIQDIYAGPTIRAIAAVLETAAVVEGFPIVPVAKSEYYPVSSSQKRMYVINQLEKEQVTYNMPWAMVTEDDVDPKKLENVIVKLIQRHESLRTSFAIVADQVVQKVHDEFDFCLHYRQSAEENTTALIDRFIKPFNLAACPLLRAELVRLPTGKHLFLLDMHHIVSDGFSMQICLQELALLYQGMEVAPPKLQYKDFSAWQYELCRKGVLKAQQEYWLKLLQGELPVLNMPTDYPRPTVDNLHGDRVRFKAHRHVTTLLKKLAAEQGVTLYMLLLAAFNVLLARYSGQEDLIVGTPIAGRHYADLDKVVGLFVNTLALRNYPESNKTFLSFLGEVRKNVLGAFQNQDFPFEELVNQLNIPRETGRNPIFDTMFVMQSFRIPQMDLGDVRLVLCDYTFKIAKFDLTLQAVENHGAIDFEFEYATELYEKETIIRMAGHLINILKDISEQPQKAIARIEMLSKKEKYEVVAGFNNTRLSYPAGKTYQELFQDRVALTPHKTALVFQGRHLSYQELNGKANQLARLLREKGVGQDTVVGIMVEPSLEMFLGILAILKSGGAYMPVDPAYPAERINYMIEDSGARILLTQPNLQKKLPRDVQPLQLDIDRIPDRCQDNLEIQNSAADLAYLIYTSGSTGQPKGVMIEHRSVHNFIVGMSERIQFREDKTILVLTAMTFDIFFLETLLPLTKGMKIFIAGKEEKEPAIIEELIISNRVRMIQMTPSRANLFFDADKLQWLSHIEEVMIGGEPLSETLLQKLRSKTKAKIYNMYGPTETTIWSTMQDVTAKDTVTIGSPVANTQIYILNSQGRLQPVGVPGELWIAGDGLARGYMGRQDLTQEKFIDNPFHPGTKMYRTGDLARWRPDGIIEFLGRIDFQVKIRGYRIELGEIEACLADFPRIENAIVMARRDKMDKEYLCAYYKAESDLNVAKLKAFLAEKLPNYMIPAYFVRLAQIPLNNNGKVDRRKLPEPIFGSQKREASNRPRNEIETTLADIWCNVLNLEEVGINENFFEIGGDSLSAMLVNAKAISFHWNLTLQDFYRYQTIADLAAKIQGKMSGERRERHPVSLEMGELAHAPSQAVPAGGQGPRPWQNVLLTGATGYLGIHLLDEILSNTAANVFCLVRGGDPEAAEERLQKSLEFYFDGKYQNQVGQRIRVVNGDITLEKFGLTRDDYRSLAVQADIIIHAAAVVKHYGESALFKKVNVEGTARLVALAAEFNKSLHHVSTMSVFGGMAHLGPRSVTENDFYIGQDLENIYVQSKFEAEKLIFEAMGQGLQAAVYRVGNLSERHRDGQFQMNRRDNMFHNILQGLIQTGICPDILLENHLELTPVDACSRALIGLAGNREAVGGVFHLFNHHFIKVRDILAILNPMGIKVEILRNCGMEEYMTLLAGLPDRIDSIKFLINGLQNEITINDPHNPTISSEQTLQFLNRFGFSWPVIDKIYLQKVLEQILLIRV